MYDSQCMNYNFLAYFNPFWTLTADSSNTYKVYKVNGILTSMNASTYSQPKIVLNISSDALCSEGNGTIKNPYIIEAKANKASII